MPTEVFSGILKTIASNFTNQIWPGLFLINLAKANNFEMTLMFAESAEKKYIDDIVSKVRKEDGMLADKI